MRSYRAARQAARRMLILGLGHGLVAAAPDYWVAVVTVLLSAAPHEIRRL